MFNGTLVTFEEATTHATMLIGSPGVGDPYTAVS
jgi:hypothetical protein